MYYPLEKRNHNHGVLELDCRSIPCFHLKFTNYRNLNNEPEATLKKQIWIFLDDKIAHKRLVKAFNYAIEHYSPGKTPW